MSTKILCMEVAVLGLLSSPAWGQACAYGEPASGNCAFPRVIGGTEGQHVVLMDGTGATDSRLIGGVPVGNIVYFDVVPQISGPMTVSTCHPNTMFDTVVGLYQRGELCEFTYLAANDDSTGAECPQNCTGYASELTYDVTAGVTYTIMVGSYNSNPQGCLLCIGLIVTLGTPCGEPPRNFVCGVARELSGAAGTQYVLLDTGDIPDLGTEAWGCQAYVGRTLWFRMVPEVSGPLFVSTCQPGTGYDTVVRILQYFDEDCVGMAFEPACVDDDVCQYFPFAAYLTHTVEAGRTYYVEVGGYVGQGGCLEAEFTLTDACESDADPPVAVLDLLDFTCVPTEDPGYPLFGDASDPDGNFLEYTLEARATTGSWSVIAYGSDPVTGGLLGTWDTQDTAGYHLLRLTVRDRCGKSNTAVRLVYVDAGPHVSINWPNNGQSISGNVCIDGTARHGVCAVDYRVDYRPLGSGSWQPVDPGQPDYAGPVYNLALAYWDTVGTGIPDGTYELRVRATSIGGEAEQIIQVDVDNTPPIAEITDPVNCSGVSGSVPVHGTARDAHLSRWIMQYTGGNIHTWQTFAEGYSPVASGMLGEWNTAGLPPCAYTLRLIVYESTPTGCMGVVVRSEFLVSVSIRDPASDADLDDDGDVDLNDYGIFASVFTGPL